MSNQYQTKQTELESAINERDRCITFYRPKQAKQSTDVAINSLVSMNRYDEVMELIKYIIPYIEERTASIFCHTSSIMMMNKKQFHHALTLSKISVELLKNEVALQFVRWAYLRDTAELYLKQKESKIDYASAGNMFLECATNMKTHVNNSYAISDYFNAILCWLAEGNCFKSKEVLTEATQYWRFLGSREGLSATLLQHACETNDRTGFIIQIYHLNAHIALDPMRIVLANRVLSHFR